jgi:hypothetical protein
VQTDTRNAPTTAETGEPPVERLGPTGRRVRVVVALVGIVALLAGALVGQDDDFPFGPFRMYATADKLNSPVQDTRLDAVDASGRRFALSDNATGFRRAELEGQLPQIRKDPSRLSALATAYAARHRGAPPLVEIDVVIRWDQLRDGRPTGKYTEQTVAVWKRAS